MNCVPPWLSSKMSCNNKIIAYNHTHQEIATMIYEKFVQPKMVFYPTEAEKGCKHPCRRMTNKLSAKLSVQYEINGALLLLRFKKRVRVEKKVIVYTWFNFIIDVGSSLGLWLGLSALGITDLAIEGFRVIRKWLRGEFGLNSMF